MMDDCEPHTYRPSYYYYYLPVLLCNISGVLPFAFTSLLMRDTLLLPLVLGLLAFPCASQILRRLSHDESANEHHVHLHERNLSDVELFQKIAMTFSSSDKVRGKEGRTRWDNQAYYYPEGHRYSVMYGTFLLPYVRRFHQMQLPIKFFEIGLGCYMDYGMLCICTCYFIILW